MPTLPPNLRGVLVSCLAFAACDNPAAPTIPTLPLPPDVRPWVSGNAADRVDSQGHFLLPDPVAPDAEPIISRQRATDLGAAFVRTWLWEESTITFPFPGAVSFRDALREEHGAPIAWRRLEPVRSAVYLAQSPYELPSEELPVPVRRVIGPYYVMSLAADGVLVSGFAVSAYSTDLVVTAEGKIGLPRFSGNEFRFYGIPRNDQRPHPIWPEEAVRLVATTTGARITEVPRLVGLGLRFSPQLARWELRLDREVRLRNSETGEERASNVVYIGVGTRRKLTWHLPKKIQPAEEPLTYSLLEGGQRSIMLRIRPDVPLQYDPVVPVP